MLLLQGPMNYCAMNHLFGFDVAVPHGNFRRKHAMAMLGCLALLHYTYTFIAGASGLPFVAM